MFTNQLVTLKKKRKKRKRKEKKRKKKKGKTWTDSPTGNNHFDIHLSTLRTRAFYNDVYQGCKYWGGARGKVIKTNQQDTVNRGVDPSMGQGDNLVARQHLLWACTLSV